MKTRQPHLVQERKAQRQRARGPVARGQGGGREGAIGCLTGWRCRGGASVPRAATGIAESSPGLSVRRRGYRCVCCDFRCTA